MNTISSAINAYSALAKAVGSDGTETGDTQDQQPAAPGADFASVLKDTAKGAVNTLKEGETATAAGIAGKADIRDVVAAVTSAELTLETVVNVRDKVVNAYNEILRMPI
ncbi:MAG: flagellar hook-basal body complex protein FliE [Magnetospirillum sp.]|nr:flagellar hook-basal body complex protein FliE [Magnetospirillum sp.]